MGAWSQLPDDIWCVVAGNMQTAGERIRFRSVCRTWRSLLPFPQPPWLMLSEDEHNPSYRGFVAAAGAGAVVHQFELPEVHHTKIVGSTGTWLITVDLHFRIRLLNPFSRLQIDLPPLTTLRLPHMQDVRPECRSPEFFRNYYLRKVVLSSSTPSECIAMALYHSFKQAYARPGDTSWTPVVTPPRTSGVLDVIFYKGRFHAITILGILIAYNLSDNPVTATQLCEEPKSVSANGNVKYLVECAGGLLLVVKYLDYVFDRTTRELEKLQMDRFEVYKFDFCKRKWTRAKDLGDYCLFLGVNTSVAMSVSSNPGLKKNCIYFTDDHVYRIHPVPKIRFIGVFDLQDDTFRPHYKGTSTSSYSPPLWIVP